MRRRTFLLSAVWLCVCLLSGCIGPSLHMILPAQVDTRYIAEYADRWCYTRLDKNMQENYGNIYAAVMEGMNKDEKVTVGEGDAAVTGWGIQVRLPHSLERKEQMLMLFRAFSHDNPQFFFLSHNYGLLGFQEEDIQRYNGIVLLYTMDATARRRAQREIEQCTADICSKAETIADSFERELLLHDWLAEQCTYETAAETPLTAYSAYGALVQGRAVCEGYARGLQWLLRKNGIDGTLVLGAMPDGEAHMWNLVEIDGEEYHVDLTWNDTDDLPRHNYLNITTAETEQTHTLWDTFGVEPCTATSANYYRRRGMYLETYSREVLAEKIAAAVQTGATAVELRLPPEYHADAVQFIESGEDFFRMVDMRLHGDTMWNFYFYHEPAEGTLLLMKSNV